MNNKNPDKTTQQKMVKNHLGQIISWKKCRHQKGSLESLVKGHKHCVHIRGAMPATTFLLLVKMFFFSPHSNWCDFYSSIHFSVPFSDFSFPSTLILDVLLSSALTLLLLLGTQIFPRLQLSPLGWQILNSLDLYFLAVYLHLDVTPDLHAIGLNPH